MSLTPISNNKYKRFCNLSFIQYSIDSQKKRDSDKTIWRRSWESGHSHSSCSLQSNITNALSGNGKDEFWAALQTNYNYIMDTNLLDSCREARGELECVKSTEVKIPDCCQKVKRYSIYRCYYGNNVLFFIFGSRHASR
jgi:hypothetical protein